MTPASTAEEQEEFKKYLAEGPDEVFALAKSK